MIVLVDADSLVWSCSYNVETLDEAKDKFDQHLMKIVNDLEEYGDVEQVRVFHGAKGNFRYEIDKEYKANRKSERPEFYKELSHYVKEQYNATSAINEEVDDLVAREYKSWESLGNEVVIASIDKDYKQLPAKIYTWHYKNPGLTEQSQHDADLFFWSQMLEGDRADNVKGVEGIGKVKAKRILSDSKTRYSMLRRVYTTYLENYPENARKRFTDTYKLLKIG